MCLINLRVYLPNLRVFLPFWAFFSFFCLQNGQKTPQFTLNLLSTFDQKNETLKCLKKKVLWESQVLKSGVLNIGYLLYWSTVYSNVAAHITRIIKATKNSWLWKKRTPPPKGDDHTPLHPSKNENEKCCWLKPVTIWNIKRLYEFCWLKIMIWGVCLIKNNGF